jgi:hypothetical protein
MRHPAIDMDLPPRRAPSILARLHWPRIIALTVALSLWPAIIFAASRFL